MSEINSFPISTKLFEDLQQLSGSQASFSDEKIIYDKDQNIVKRISLNEERKFNPFVYKTISDIESADLPVDSEHPIYIRRLS